MPPRSPNKHTCLWLCPFSLPLGETCSWGRLGPGESDPSGVLKCIDAPGIGEFRGGVPDILSYVQHS